MIGQLDHSYFYVFIITFLIDNIWVTSIRRCINLILNDGLLKTMEYLKHL